jgi:hypothetical protein
MTKKMKTATGAGAIVTPTNGLSEDMVRINFMVPASVRKAWKGAALREDKTVKDLLIEAMEAHLASIEKAVRQ